MFSHPGAYGVVMLPPKAVKAGFFARRRRATAVTRAAASASAAEAAASKATSNAQARCANDSSLVDGLVSDAKASAEAERALRMEAARLLAKKTHLEKEIRQLQRDKEELTDAHRAQLERLRRDLDVDTRESKRRLGEELERGHAKSMDSLRLTLKSETEHLATETKRLREELHKARHSRSAASTATEANRARSRASTRGAVSGGGNSRGSTSSLFGANPNGGLDAEGISVMPRSAGFWKSLTDTFTPGDLLGANVMGVGGGGESVPPPALMVLAAVPLFCLYKRWQQRR